MSKTGQTMRTVTPMRYLGSTLPSEDKLPSTVLTSFSHFEPTFNSPVSPLPDTTSSIIRMVLWLEPKACTNCGLMQAGHTRKNCPDIKCFRCHKHGHISNDCPNTKCSIGPKPTLPPPATQETTIVIHSSTGWRGKTLQKLSQDQGSLLL